MKKVCFPSRFVHVCRWGHARTAGGGDPFVDLGNLKAGMTVGVFGCGPIGLLIIQLARLSGATNIIATDILPHRVDAAKALGRTSLFGGGQAPELEEIRAATRGAGVDVAFEAAGEQEAVDAAFAAFSPEEKSSW